jgi:hypothetical protein
VPSIEGALLYSHEENEMKFYANPYNFVATGFYFESNDEFLEKSAALRDNCDNVVEEFMIEVIDGTKEQIDLVNAIGIDQGNMEKVIEYIESSDENEWPAMFFLLDNNIVDKLDDAKDKADDVCITESRLIDAASKLFDKRYVDYEKFARDCMIGGDMTEFEFGGKTYTCTNANGL